MKPPIITRPCSTGIGVFTAFAVNLLAFPALAAICPFDTGGSDALNDGVVLTRYALGITGSPLVASTRYASLDPLQVKNNIECVGCALDMNGDGQIDTVDTTIIARHLAGFKEASLTGGLALGSGSRNTTAAVTSFLANGCAVGGAVNAFTLGGNAFGNVATRAVLGTTDGRPLLVGTGDGSGLKISPFATASLPGALAITNGAATNSASAAATTVAGGGFNRSDCYDSVTRDLTRNCANVATGLASTVGGGAANSAGTGDYSTVAGGLGNAAAFDFSTISGGLDNLAIAMSSTVGGGQDNIASGPSSTVVGGALNLASGVVSTVAGGELNVASGSHSFAAGKSAYADKAGTFVWADASTSTPFKVTTNWQQPTYGANTFNVRATGGVVFATSMNTSTAAPATYCLMGVSGTGWTCASDRNVKERVEPITPSRVLAGVLAMPVSTWSIIGSKFRQMGPMAQDFYRAFGLGDTDTAINSIDASGVAFAAIQGLHELLKDKDAKIAVLKKANAATQRDVALMKKRLGM
jgi:trimeric autotransporter adhesin